MSVLDEQVLVLNKNYYALCFIDVREAFKLLSSEKALAMDENYTSHNLASWQATANLSNHSHVRTTTNIFAAPLVLRLTSFDKIIEYTLSLTRQNLFHRDNHICQYCGVQMPVDLLTIDHVIPKSRMLEFELSHEEVNGWENIVTSCQGCNSTKNNKTPSEANMPLIKLPSKPKEGIRGLDVYSIDTQAKPIWSLYIKSGVK